MAQFEKEIWESTIPGRISVQVLNSRGRPQEVSILGKGQRLRLTPEERVLVEEQVRDPQNNPFRNGMLVQVGGPAPEPEVDGSLPDTDQALLDADLGALFELRESDFEDAVRALSEINVRRLNAMVDEQDASKSQIDFLDKYIAETWPIGADTASNAEARGDRTVTV